MPVVGQVGELSRNQANVVDGSYIAGGDITFGKAVQLAAGSVNKVVEYDGTGPILGIAVKDPSAGFSRDASGLSSEVLKYTAGKQVAVLKQGAIFVTAGSTVVAGEQVYIAHSTGSGVTVGDFLDDNSAATNKTALKGSMFRTSGAGGAVVEIEINWPLAVPA